ncbi:LysM peptidoglycan-binding domain-containing protein [Paenibacillus hubeiensis]|uniref:LysM peptidoglycan-binding domain-containing protein n=1 Tax=Paenibacillus hubeiensis TaxID=3077330 RepID=UPI0031BBCB40
MLNQPYGLRFDIYERVHLSEGVPAIEELEEIELFPRIQVIGQEDYATLRGHLLLTGAYRGENDYSEELKHFIPVEITVPLNRVRSLDDISIEIENFDVDLLSERSLNITGVLSLRGIQGFAAEENQGWPADEFTVVHSPELPQDGFETEPEQPDSEINVHAQEYLLQRSEEERLIGAPKLDEAARGLLYQPEADNAFRLDDSLEPETINGPVSGQVPAEQPQLLAQEATEREPGVVEEAEANEAAEANGAAHLSFFGAAYSEPIDTASDPDANTDVEERTAADAAKVPAPPEPEPSLPAWHALSASSLPEHANQEREAQESRQSREAFANPWTLGETRSAPTQEEQKEESAGGENWQDVFAASEAVVPAKERESNEVQLADPPAETPSAIPEPVAETEDKPELKVAFGSKRETRPPQEDGFGISSLISGKGTREAEEERPNEAAAETSREPSAASEEVQWKNLFLGSLVEQTPFRKVKMCIVQREETLDTIADRYQLTTRELQLYNRLSEQVVEEGQVLYIP